MNRYVLPLLGLAAACAPEDFAPQAELEDQQLVYGNDDRLDYYQASAALRAAADSTVALFDANQVVRQSNGTYRVDSTPTLAQSYSPMCSGEPFRTQPATAYCSGFQVGPDTIATAGHCVSTSSCSGTRFVFGFRMDSSTSVRSTVAANDVYDCTQVVARSNTGTLDYAIVRVDRTITGHTPLAVRQSGTVPNGTPLVLIGHPAGMPSKIAGGATVRSNSPTNYFEANVDSYGGNSGSAVLNANTLEVEGILVRGNSDWDFTGSCYTSNVCPDSGCPGWEDATKATTFASLIPGGTGGNTCTEDSFEDNDTQGTAANLLAGTYSNLQICTNDDDWYDIDVRAGETVTIDLAFVHANGDLDMALFDGGTRVGLSQGTTNTEQIVLTATTARTYSLRVYGYNGAAGAYTLEVGLTGGAPAGMTLSTGLNPTAGAFNVWSVTDAPATTRLYLIAGQASGSANLPGCPGVSTGLAAPFLVSQVTSTPSGTATFALNVPAGVRNQTYTFRAASIATCEVSAPLTLTFQ